MNTYTGKPASASAQSVGLCLYIKRVKSQNLLLDTEKLKLQVVVPELEVCMMTLISYLIHSMPVFSV